MDRELFSSVRIKVDTVGRRSDLVNYLQWFNLPFDGTMSVLRERLRDHLKIKAGKSRHPGCVQLTLSVGRPSAICEAGKDVLVCADDNRCVRFQIVLEFDGITIFGNTTMGVAYPECISTVASMTVLDLFAYFSGTTSAGSEQGYLFRCCLQRRRVEAVLSASNQPG